MTAKRLCLLASLVVGAVLASPGHLGTAVAEEASSDALRAAMERTFLAAQKDHATARAPGFADRVTDLAAALRTAIGAARAATAAPVPDDVAKSLAAVPGVPLSLPTLRVVVAALLPADRAAWPADTDEAVRDALLAAVRAVFHAESFADCWDTKFQDLPEVAAWRKAHAAPGPAVPPPPGPVPSPPPGPEGSGPVPPQPAPEAGPTPPAAPALPRPDDADAAANLVPLDRGRAWVGPWTGWVQDLPEKDNHRQRRAAKTVWIDRYEVTCAAYLAFLKGLPAAKRRAMLPVAWSVDEAVTPSFPEGRASWPVTGVTYAQAAAYADAVGKRLPTEDEWDRAASGGEKDARAFPWGAEPGDRRWTFAGAGADSPADVDAAPSDRTPDGIVGLAGNVAEMVATTADRRDAPAKPQPTQQIVVRGGSWKTSRTSDCGTTFRWVIEAGQGAPHVGFRCVMDEPEYRKRFGK